MLRWRWRCALEYRCECEWVEFCDAVLLKLFVEVIIALFVAALGKANMCSMSVLGDTGSRKERIIGMS